jgi:hypothetical protein
MFVLAWLALKMKTSVAILSQKTALDRAKRMQSWFETSPPPMEMVKGRMLFI